LDSYSDEQRKRDTGNSATSPWRMPWAGWKQVLSRVWTKLMSDNAGLIAAGVAFYAFLSFVPAIAALLLVYGLFASPAELSETMIEVSEQLPAEAAAVVNDQIVALTLAPDDAKGWGLLIALALAIYGATKGVDAIVTAINVAYEEDETRGFIRRTLLVFAMTGALSLFTLLSLISVSILHLPAVLLPLMPFDTAWLIAAGSYLLLALSGAVAAALIYRFAPDREPARMAWLTPGGIATAVMWGAITSGFGVYSSTVGNYGATYGSLAGVVALLTWLYFSAYALIIGAKINAELELQTYQDTTTGPELPMGQRGAEVADHVVGSQDV
jgi:membrane protein